MYATARSLTKTLGLLCSVMVVWDPSTVRAQRKPVVQLDAGADTGIALAAAALAMGFQFRTHTPPAHCAPLCDERDLNALDARVAGNYNPSWRTGSHVGAGLALGLSLAWLLTGTELRPAVTEMLTVAEATLVATGFNVLTTYAVGRPRPYMYGTRAPEDVRDDGDGQLSFPSGHTVTAVAATTATAFTLFRRNQSRLAWWALATGTAVSAFVGVSRSLAGDHFPTDVLVGATFGAGVGLAVPALHRRATLRAELGRTGGSLAAMGRFEVRR